MGEGEFVETFLALKEIETIEAGQPALYIFGDTTDYDAEDDNHDLQRAISEELEADTLEDIYTDGVDYWFEDDLGEKIIVIHVLEIEED